MKPGDLVKVQLKHGQHGFGIIISERFSSIGREWIVKITGNDGLTICSPVDLEVVSESTLR